MRLSARLASPAWLLMACLAAGTAGAEERLAPDPASVPASVRAEVEALLQRAKALFAEQEYRRALPLVERAHHLHRSGRTAFNLGVLHHQLSECEPAWRHFELYLQLEPNGAARAAALVALAELRAQCPAAAPSTAPASLVPPAEGPSTSGLAGVGTAASALTAPVLTEPAVTAPAMVSERSAPAAPASRPLPAAEVAPSSWTASSPVLVLLGLGVAAGVGTAASLLAQSRAQQELDELGVQARAGEPWDELEQQRRDLAADARLYRGLSVGLGAASLALLGVGVTVWILDDPQGASGEAHGAGVMYHARF